jgi:hypothetical protein
MKSRTYQLLLALLLLAVPLSALAADAAPAGDEPAVAPDAVAPADCGAPQVSLEGLLDDATMSVAPQQPQQPQPTASRGLWTWSGDSSCQCLVVCSIPQCACSEQTCCPACCTEGHANLC